MNPTIFEFASAAASSVALAADVFGQTAAPDYWNWSAKNHEAVGAALLGFGDRAVRAAVSRLTDSPQDGTVHHDLVRLVAAWLSAIDAGTREQFEGVVRQAEQVSRLRMHVGSRWVRTDGVVGLTELTRFTGGEPSRNVARNGVVDAAVVIPFRADGDDRRTRNLVAVLKALNDQTYRRDRYRVVVVETDKRPRWQHVIEPLCDRYIFAVNAGAFNKSWAVNVGVVQDRPSGELLCVLDGDILVENSFIERAVRRFAEFGTQAHWPFKDMLFLDERSSNLAVDRRCLRQAPTLEYTQFRGVYLRRPPGGCIWLRRSLFERIGGMDERFEGWGGEDQDFEWRVDRYGALDRHSDPIVHLNHSRSPYRDADGRPFFEEIGFCSWPCDSRIGDIAAYARPGQLLPHSDSG